MIKLIPKAQVGTNIGFGLALYLTKTNKNPQGNNTEKKKKNEVVSIPGQGVLTVEALQEMTYVPNFGWVDKNNRKSVGKLLEFLVNQGLDVGKHGIDKRWGNDTNKALNEYLANPIAKNEQAIIRHKQKYNVKDPYIIVDKLNAKMIYFDENGNRTEFPITYGMHKGDAYFPEFSRIYNSSDIPQGMSAYSYIHQPEVYGSQTPGGIFLAKPFENYGHYDKNGKFTGGYLNTKGEVAPTPIIRLRDQQGEIIPNAIHAPAGLGRVAALKTNNRRVSSGCISGNCGVNEWLAPRINEGDTVYILPETRGNYIYEGNDGMLRTKFTGNNPTTSPNGKHELRYNIDNEEFVTGPKRKNLQLLKKDSSSVWSTITDWFNF